MSLRPVHLLPERGSVLSFVDRPWRDIKNFITTELIRSSLLSSGDSPKSRECLYLFR